MEYPSHAPGRYYQLLQQYKEAQLFLAALELDIFSYLDQPRSLAVLAERTGYHPRNLELFLHSLAAIGLIRKETDGFVNTPEAALYLSRSSRLPLGEYFRFWQEMTSLADVSERVKHGPDPAIAAANDGHQVYQFRELARLAATEAYTGRVQSLLASITPLFPADAPLHILDLGGGSGVMAIELLRHFAQATGVIFEHPAVAEVPARHVKEHKLTDRLRISSGNFNTDSIGTNYDLIIASGIMDFASSTLQATVDKMAAALKPHGYLYLVAHHVSDDLLSPKEAIINWLSSHLAGLELLQPRSTIETALQTAGFKKQKAVVQQGLLPRLSGDLYQRS